MAFFPGQMGQLAPER